MDYRFAYICINLHFWIHLIAPYQSTEMVVGDGVGRDKETLALHSVPLCTVNISISFSSPTLPSLPKKIFNSSFLQHQFHSKNTHSPIYILKYILFSTVNHNFHLEKTHTLFSFLKHPHILSPQNFFKDTFNFCHLTKMLFEIEAHLRSSLII